MIVQYDHDPDTDMFQIGRSSEDQIDFIVMDTVPGNQRSEQSSAVQSTISRFACRILVERNPPHSARIFAAGFDGGKNIFLGVGFLFDLCLTISHNLVSWAFNKRKKLQSGTVKVKLMDSQPMVSS